MSSRELNILVKAKNLASQTLKSIKGEINGLGKIGGKAGRNLATNFERGVLLAGAGVVGLGTAALKTAIDFEDAFAGIRKTVDETELAAAGLSFDTMMEDFRAMAREMPVAFEELAAIGEAAGALGIAAGDIDDFTAVVAKLGVTTDLTSDQAATALGHLGTILGLTGSDFEELADSLVALGNDGASTESQIIAIAERFAAAGTSAGLAKEDILALSSVAASMGIDAEAAGSSLSRLFNNTTTNIALSKDEAKEFAKALGLTFDDFKDAWDKDALGTFEDLLTQLSTLDKFEAADLLAKLGITNIRDVDAIRRIAGNVGELTDQLETANTAQGALNEEASKKFATTASQVTKFKNILRDAGFVIGKELLPIVNELLTDFAEFMATPEAQAGIKQFAKDFAANVREAVEWLRSLDWKQIGDVMSGVAGAAKGLLDAFLGMPAWVQQAVLTGWGLNKLTGGAVGDLIGHLAGGIIKGIMNINAGVVNVNGKVVTGGPGGGAPLIGGGAAGAAGGLTVAGALGAGAVGAAAAVPLAGGLLVSAHITDQFGDLNDQLKALGLTAEEIQAAKFATGDVMFQQSAAKHGFGSPVALQEQAVQKLADMGFHLERTTDGMKLVETATREGLGDLRNEFRVGRIEQMAEQRRVANEAHSFDQNMLTTARTQTDSIRQQKAVQERANALIAGQKQHLQAIEGVERGQSGTLTGILNKRSSVNVNVTTVANIVIQEWQRVAQRQHFANAQARYGGII